MDLNFKDLKNSMIHGLRKKSFEPDWTDTAPEKETYRSIFKWGSPDGFKHPNTKLYNLLKEAFHLTDSDFSQKINEGNKTVSLNEDRSIGIPEGTISRFIEIAGKENVKTDDFSRVKYSSGKATEEALELREGVVSSVSDVVIHPENREHVREIVSVCNEMKIPVYAYGGGSSVTLGLKPEKGGVTLVMSTHMNRVLDFNETNQTITVESGMMGPAYEECLNNAPYRFSAGHSYTGGHFPQSFEYSSVGGWITAKGSGQLSSYYGDACDLVISQEYVTPSGTFKTLDYPSTATGPMVNDIMKGSEGAYGILTSVTLKFFKHMPENRKRFSFIFPEWKDAVLASAEITQGEFGFPSVFRISDPEETYVGLKQHGIEGTFLDRLMTMKGYKPMQRCLCLGHTEGEKAFSKNVFKKIKKICKKHGAMYLTGYPVKLWEHGKYNDPYLREDLNDFGIIIDTLETGVTWSNLHKVHTGARQYVKSRPDTICMTHCSHLYQQGTNLYFIFIGKFESREEYITFHRGIIDSISKNGGSLSHHHGIGKMMAPWMEEHLGKEQLNVLKALKEHFDPNNIMNPGGTMGLE